MSNLQKKVVSKPSIKPIAKALPLGILIDKEDPKHAKTDVLKALRAVSDEFEYESLNSNFKKILSDITSTKYSNQACEVGFLGAFLKTNNIKLYHDNKIVNLDNVITFRDSKLDKKIKLWTTYNSLYGGGLSRFIKGDKKSGGGKGDEVLGVLHYLKNNGYTYK